MGICERWHIQIGGTVQGVGFRPFVYRTAVDLGLVGLVRNTSKGVSIEAQGEETKLKSFTDALRNQLPPLAEIRSLSHESMTPSDDSSFVIETSATGTHEVNPSISPDIATCDDCLNELLSEDDRRHGYAFTNCTNCGPRYTIIEGFPYDRPLTSMKNFEMCPACNKEYNNPANRRFHAQPNACAECGPQLNMSIPDTLNFLHDGKIVAIKGLGGYHLACDATNNKAVQMLRERKQRNMKPFAIMVRDLEAARAICMISDDEAKLLTSPRRPIVLLTKKEGTPIADSVAPGNNCLGIMLPYTPLHHLLFESRAPSPEPRVFVMTSANFSEEPIIADDDEAKQRLSSIADAFLTHDRPIHMRTDDSVVRPVENETIVIRRARGYVPQSIELPFEGPSVLATGGDIKNVFCLTEGKNAYLSQHIGDLENAETHTHFERTIEHLCSLLKIKPEIVACDLHPDYFSSGFARSSPFTLHSSLFTEVQHHHAHIASCMAENGIPNQKVIGIALDGVGYGPDGTIWGGEILRADYADYERVGRFKPVPQPGGDRAAKETWRMAISYGTRDSELGTRIAKLLTNVSAQEKQLVLEAIEKDINCPLTSSCGRLFDAVAAITGCATNNAYEGQGAMILEHAASPDVTEAYPFEISLPKKTSTSPNPSLQRRGTISEIDFTRMIKAIAEDVTNNVDVSVISARFHNAIIVALVRMVESVQNGEPVVLSGGCFQNAYLLTNLTNALEARGKTVYTHRLIPPNDGGLALGQAVIAAYRWKEK